MSVNLNNGVLKINGTEKNDFIRIIQNENEIEVKYNNVESHKFKSDEIKKIEAHTLAGKDTVMFDDNRKGSGDKNIPCIIFTGDGDDEIWSGPGDDIIFGGKGNDKIYDGRGNDIVDGGEGNDNIEIGTGKNEITGGKGADNIRSIFSGNKITVDNEDTLNIAKRNKIIRE